MKCPYCDAPETKVLDSRNIDDDQVIRRKRKCESCQKRFTTIESIQLTMPMVIKRDGRREAYSHEKISRGIEKAVEKLLKPALTDDESAEIQAALIALGIPINVISNLKKTDLGRVLLSAMAIAKNAS